MSIRSEEPGKNTVWLGLGGNVGDVKASLKSALDMLEARNDTEFVRVSPLYETPPWGDENQANFLNICSEIRTSLAPIELLDVVQHIERELKRTKTHRWGPRTIDIDLLVYQAAQCKTERLTLPHPRMTKRCFVLMPLCDIAPDLVVQNRSVADWLAAANCDGVKQIAMVGEW